MPANAASPPHRGCLRCLHSVLRPHAGPNSNPAPPRSPSSPPAAAGIPSRARGDRRRARQPGGLLPTRQIQNSPPHCGRRQQQEPNHRARVFKIQQQASQDEPGRAGSPLPATITPGGPSWANLDGPAYPIKNFCRIWQSNRIICNQACRRGSPWTFSAPRPPP